MQALEKKWEELKLLSLREAVVEINCDQAVIGEAGKLRAFGAKRRAGSSILSKTLATILGLTTWDTSNDTSSPE